MLLNPDAQADAVVAMSGGQDSTTCLAWALEEVGAGRVHAVTFDYGQKHRVELECAAEICEQWNVPAFNELGAAALTNRNIDVDADAAGTGNEHAERIGLPSTFVPGRNLIFLGLVAAYAAQHDIPNVITGVCAADEAGYPDCRPEFIVSFQDTARIAMGIQSTDKLKVYAPLLYLDKAGTFALADEAGALKTIIEQTHTCYNGDHETFHRWGYGCGDCPACQERANGFQLFEASQTPA